MTGKRKALGLAALAAVAAFAVGVSGCTKKAKTVTFADVGWDSVKFHNAVAGLIAKEVYGYEWESLPGSSAIMHEAMLKGEIDVNMEEWTDNLATYDQDLEAGRFK